MSNVLGEVVFNGMVKESLMEKVTFEQRLGGIGEKSVGITHK